MIRRFHDFLNLVFGGFLQYYPTVRRRRQLAAHLRAHNRPDVVLASLAAVVAQLKSAAQLPLLLTSTNSF